METGKFGVNEGKAEVVSAAGDDYHCYAIKTKVVLPEDKLEDVMDEFVRPVLMSGDIVFISEKMVACTQGRAIPMKDIHPGFWAKFLSKFVTKAPGGIGLGMPETMHFALKECGFFRILLASFVSAIGKLLGKKGWFYKVAGDKATTIDGPCEWTIPPYNHYVVLGPVDPDGVAKRLSNHLGGHLVMVVDINDRAGMILGSSAPVDKTKMLALLKQNPLGQSQQSTPVGILRQGTAVETA